MSPRGELMSCESRRNERGVKGHLLDLNRQGRDGLLLEEQDVH